jgi:hypothetical protein
MLPNKKVQAGTLAAALTTVIVGIAGMFEVKVPPELAASAATLVFALVAYFVPDKAPQKESK